MKYQDQVIQKEINILVEVQIVIPIVQFQLVAGIVTSQNLLFQMREVLMFCISGKEMGAPTGNWLYDSARDLTEMASMQFAVYGLMNPYTYQRPKITPLPNETGLTVPGGTGSGSGAKRDSASLESAIPSGAVYRISGSGAGMGTAGFAGRGEWY